jgi:hypothetical protein
MSEADKLHGLLVQTPARQIVEMTDRTSDARPRPFAIFFNDTGKPCN